MKQKSADAKRAIMPSISVYHRSPAVQAFIESIVRQNGWNFKGSGRDYKSLEAHLKSENPAEVVIVDVGIKDDDSKNHLIRILSKAYPERRFVAHLPPLNSLESNLAHCCDAKGYLTYWSDSAEVTEQICRICGIHSDASNKTSNLNIDFLGFIAPLPDSERKIARALSQGLTKSEIAKTMKISKKTIETYVARAIKHLGLGSSQSFRYELIRRATTDVANSMLVNALSPNEKRVLEYIAAGNVGNKEIAGKMNVSIKTIETYKGRIRKKTGLQSGPQITIFAIQCQNYFDRQANTSQ